MPNLFQESSGKAGLYEDLSKRITIYDVGSEKVTASKINAPHHSLKDALLALDDFLQSHILYDKTANKTDDFKNDKVFVFDKASNCGIESSDDTDANAWKLDAKDGVFFKKIKNFTGSNLKIVSDNTYFDSSGYLTIGSIMYKDTELYKASGYLDIKANFRIFPNPTQSGEFLIIDRNGTAGTILANYGGDGVNAYFKIKPAQQWF